MVHHGRWLNHPNSLLKGLERKSKKRAEELRSRIARGANHLAHHARFAPETIHVDIEARTDDGDSAPLGVVGANDLDPGAVPEPDREANPELANPEPANPVPANPEPANPEPANPEPANPEPANPEPANPEQANPERVPKPAENPDSDPTHVTPEPETTVVATIVHIVLSGGTSTIAEFTVPTLPAVVSNTALGVLSIPAETDSPITIPSQNIHHAAGSATENPDSKVPTPTLESAPEAPTVPMLIGVSETAEISYATGTSEATETSNATETSEASETSGTSDDQAASTRSATEATTTLSSDSTSGTSATTTQSKTLITTSDSSSYTSAVSNGSSGSGSENTDLVGAPAPAPTTTDDADTESSTSGVLPTPKLAGAVAGSVAGFAVILLLILFLLRRRKRHLRETRGAMLQDEPEQTRSAPPRPPRPMSERFSEGPIVTAGLFNRFRQSNNSASTYETSPSERGFQKIAGRKIPSVLHTGGDGYGGGGFAKETGGGGYGAPETNPFYKEAGGYGGAAAAAASGSGAVGRQDSDSSKDSAPLRHSISAGSASSEVAVMRPGPARMATTNRAPANSESGYSTPAISAPSSTRGEPMQPSLLSVRDEVGRSQHDGSRGSRGSRFREGV